MEKKLKQKLYWPVFLPGLILGLVTLSFFFLRHWISGYWFGFLGIVLVVIIFAYYIIALRIRARAYEKAGWVGKVAVGAFLGGVLLLRITRASLGFSLFFQNLGDMLKDSGGVWFAAGALMILIAWLLSLHPVKEDPSAAPPKDAPPWEG